MHLFRARGLILASICSFQTVPPLSLLYRCSVYTKKETKRRYYEERKVYKHNETKRTERGA
ncbi:hypothetical protein RSAG8_01514, partial [Rhizoctonia solani AG-8 WAC10335]